MLAIDDRSTDTLRSHENKENDDNKKGKNAFKEEKM